MDIFSHIFKMVTPRALRQLSLFIALNCLTGADDIKQYLKVENGVLKLGYLKTCIKNKCNATNSTPNYSEALMNMQIFRFQW